MNSLKPTHKDIKDVRRGNTLRRVLTITGLDMSLVAQWLMKVKASPTQGAILSLVSGDGITVVGNQLILERTAAQMDIAQGIYKYDLVMTLTNGDVFTLIEGDFVVTNSVSVP